LISRSHVIGLGLAVGLMLAGGTGLAAADTPSPAPPTSGSAVCKIITGAGTPTIVTVAPGSGLPSAGKCPTTVVRGAVPKGAAGTGGGGMAAEVGSWH
jgi:hypothetical protein